MILKDHNECNMEKNVSLLNVVCIVLKGNRDTRYTDSVTDPVKEMHYNSCNDRLWGWRGSKGGGGGNRQTNQQAKITNH